MLIIKKFKGKIQKVLNEIYASKQSVKIELISFLRFSK
jgi:hypothetical protein